MSGPPLPPPLPPLSPAPFGSKSTSLFTEELGRFLKATSPMMRKFRVTTNIVLKCKKYNLSSEERLLMPVDLHDSVDLTQFKQVMHLVACGKPVRFSIGEMQKLQSLVLDLGRSFDETRAQLDIVDTLYAELKKSGKGGSVNLVPLSNECDGAARLSATLKHAWKTLADYVTELRDDKCPSSPSLSFTLDVGVVSALPDPVDTPEGFGNGSRLESVGDEAVFQATSENNRANDVDGLGLEIESGKYPMWLHNVLVAFESEEGHKPQSPEDLSAFIEGVLALSDRDDSSMAHTHKSDLIADAVRLLGGRTYFAVNFKDWIKRFGGDYVGLFGSETKIKQQQQLEPH